MNLFHANEELSIRKLRLLAAKARCDALVVIDYAYRRRTKANGLAALNILLVPALFTPFMDVEIASYLDAYVFDVRNDYFYGQVSATEEDIRSFSTIYATEQANLIDEQWTRMVAKVGEELSSLM
ncbi:MAG: hypothetical protein HN348_12645 [Proteobacteria bacterium]|nr:hypothetical protein [Pseudomonadota bacterium]